MEASLQLATGRATLHGEAIVHMDSRRVCVCAASQLRPEEQTLKPLAAYDDGRWHTT